MVNCGGNIDVVGLLEPPEDTVFFIVDGHRPYELVNIYSSSQVRILGTPDADDEIPEYNQVYRDESVIVMEKKKVSLVFIVRSVGFQSDEESEQDPVDGSDDEGQRESRQTKRRRLNEEDIIKRREKRQWEENREAIIFNYQQHSYYGKSVRTSFIKEKDKGTIINEILERC